MSEALELFALRGVDGVSVADIAQAASMSKANVLHHFGTKDQLYRACLEQVGERIEAAAGAADDVDAALDGWAAAHPDDVRLMAYGLLRLRERPGPWVLEGAIASLVALSGPDRSADAVVDALGRVTYRVMAEPLRPAFEATARRAPHHETATT